MKKLIAAVLTASAVTAPVIVRAEIIGAVYATDIGTLIDGAPINSYNISDSTYVKAEDLIGYGFTVEWDPAALTLSITPDEDGVRTVPSENEINRKQVLQDTMRQVNTSMNLPCATMCITL